IGKVEHAAGVWFGHNHPSGMAGQSDADFQITQRLHELMRGSGIDPLGMVVVTPGGLEASFYHPGSGYGEEAVGRPTLAARTKRGAVPMLERRFTRLQATAERGTSIRGPEAALKAVEARDRKSVV